MGMQIKPVLVVAVAVITEAWSMPSSKIPATVIVRTGLICLPTPVSVRCTLLIGEDYGWF